MKPEWRSVSYSMAAFSANSFGLFFCHLQQEFHSHAAIHIVLLPINELEKVVVCNKLLKSYLKSPVESNICVDVRRDLTKKLNPKLTFKLEAEYRRRRSTTYIR